MIYVKVPEKARVACKEDLPFYNDIQALFKKHGYGIAQFNGSGVTFYDRSKCVNAEGGGKSVPVPFFFVVSKKEFLAFVDIMRRLDDSENKRLKMIKFYSAVM